MADQDRTFNPFMYRYFLMPSKFRILLAPIIDIIILVGLFLWFVYLYILPNRVYESEYLYGFMFLYLMVTLIIHLMFLKFGSNRLVMVSSIKIYTSSSISLQVNSISPSYMKITISLS